MFCWQKSENIFVFWAVIYHVTSRTTKSRRNTVTDRFSNDTGFGSASRNPIADVTLEAGFGGTANTFSNTYAICTWA